MQNRIRGSSGLLVLVAVLTACAGRQVEEKDAINLLSTENTDLRLCKTVVSNPPRNINGQIVRESALACKNGVELLVAPAPGACMTSGFGKRRGRQHRGLDYQSKPAGPVVAAADARVVSVSVHRDFGNWIVLDHGNSIYTAYAHLASIAHGIRPEVEVRQGDSLGIMGSSGGATRAIHLHVEYRTGDINNRKGWWGLKSFNPFDQPARCQLPSSTT